MYMNKKYVLNKVAKMKREDIIPRKKGTGEWREIGRRRRG